MSTARRAERSARPPSWPIVLLVVVASTLPLVSSAGGSEAPHRGSAPTATGAATGSLNTVIATVSVGARPLAGTLDWLNGNLYVPDSYAGSVNIVSAARHAVIGTIVTGNYPSGATFDGANGDIYLVYFYGQSVTVISGATRTVLTTVVAGYNPSIPAVDSATGNVYVSNAGSSTVSVISWSTNKVTTTVSVGGEPETPAFDSANGNLYISNQASDTVSVLAGATNLVIATIPVGTNPCPAVYDDATGDVYVANFGSANVSVISGSTNQVVATIPVGPEPQSPTIDPVDRAAYVPCYGSTNVSVISTTSRSVFATVALGGYPNPGRWDRADGDLYLPTQNNSGGPSNVTVISGSNHSVIATIPVGVWATTPVYDSQNGELFVANTGSWTVSVIDGGAVVPPRFPVAFWENGLPTGSSWSVTFNGSTTTSVSNPIRFWIANGSDYNFSVGSVPGYASTPASGLVNVWGSSVTELIAFVRAIFPLWFNETGLPVGTRWSVTLVGLGASSGSSSNDSSTSSIGFGVAPAFTGLFSVSALQSYLASPASGTVTTPVPGASYTEAVSFSVLPAPGPSIAGFNITPTGLTLGESATLTVDAKGGETPLAFYYLNLPAGCPSRNASTWRCTPTAVGRFPVMVIVSDRLGRTAEANTTLTVNASAAPGPSGGGLLGLPPTEGYALLAWVAAAAIAVAGMGLWWRRRLVALSTRASRSVPPTRG